MVETAKLSLSLTLSPAVAFPGEQVQLAIGLTAGPADVPLPSLLDESAALQFELFTAGGEPVDTASGQELVRRRGYGGEPTPDDENPEDDFPAGDSVDFTVGLLDIFTPPPGEYLVAVAIRHNDTSAVSARQSLKILPAATTASAFSTGQVCLPAAHFLARITTGEWSKTSLSVRAAGGAGGLLEQFPLPTEVPGDAAIARASFGSPDDSDLDKLGWLAWVDADGLALLHYATEEGAGPILRPTLPKAVSGLLGAPFHHQDGSLTLFVLHPDAAGPELHKVVLESDGAVRSTAKIETLPGDPGAVSMSVADTAVRFLADFPVEKMILDINIEEKPKEGEEPITIWVAGEMTQLEGIPENEPVTVGCLVPNGPKVVGVALAGTKSFLLATTGGRVQLTPVELPELEADESIASTAVSVIAESGKIFAALRTSAGRLFAGAADEPLAPIDEAATDSPVGPWIASDFADGLWLYYASAAGLQRKLLYTLPPVIA